MFNKVMTYFKELCSIPHGSGNTKLISDYCTDFAASHSLDYIRDNSGNIIIFKPASKGCESSPAVIIQGHLDMVCVKTDKAKVNFETDGLILVEDDDFIWADETSLGGDDAIAVAFALAVLDNDKIAHPPLEVVFTVDEEIGMLGAAVLDTSPLNAKMLINIDSEEEDTLLVSCAGGVRADIEIPINKRQLHAKAILVSLSGFTGGHSGTEIDKGRLNAVITTAKILKDADVKSIVSINGGSADNAIPVFCNAVIYDENLPEIEEKIINSFESIKQTCMNTDPDISLTITDCECDEVITYESTKDLLDFIKGVPNSVISFSSEIDGLVQTSLNLGIIKTEDNSVTTCHALRSGVDNEKDELAKSLEEHAKAFAGQVSFYGDYPAWEYNKESKLRTVINDIYKQHTGKSMNVASIHAGLECGLFCGKIKELDCVSMGPDIYDIHTTDEKLSKKSAERVFNLLIEVLEKLSQLNK